MSSRPLVNPFPSIKNGDMSANITGSVSIINQLSMMSYGFSWAGTTPVGSISIQVSNDYSVDAGGQVKNAGTWNALTLNYGGSAVTTIPVSGNSGNGLVDILQTGAYAVRPIYTFTSGTGTLQAIFTAKVS